MSKITTPTTINPMVKLRFHPQTWINDNAPGWVRDWVGPFYVEILNRSEVEAFK